MKGGRKRQERRKIMCEEAERGRREGKSCAKRQKERQRKGHKYKE